MQGAGCQMSDAKIAGDVEVLRVTRNILMVT